MTQCPAAANRSGEHIPCQQTGGHGAIHSNKDHEIIWSGALDLRDVQIAALQILTEHADTTFLIDDPNELHVIAAQIASAVGGVS